MPIASLLSPERIQYLEGARDAAHVLETVATLSGLSGALDAMQQRERLGGTGIGHGVALPHGRLEGLPDPVGVFVRVSAPVDFGGQDTDLVFALLMPSQNPQLHLHALADIAAAFSDETFRHALRASPDVQSLRALLAQS